MPHRITIVELSIDPAHLSSTIQDWAKENKFSFYENNDNRIIYSKSMWGANAWLAVENHEEYARLEAWLASPGAGLEFTGNPWLGWKMALPEGVTFGTPFTYRRQFNKLLKQLSADSATVPIKKSTWQNGVSLSTLKKSQFSIGLRAFGIFFVLSGLISLASEISLTFQSAYFELANKTLADGVWNLIFGMMLIFSSVALNKDKALGLWLYGAGILLDVVFTLASGESLNFFFIGLSLLMTWQMFKKKNEWKLA